VNAKFLSKTETSSLVECEGVISRGLATFVEVGSALLRIRDERLYRAEFPVFEDYCRARWQMSHQRASQLIAAAGVAENLATIVAKPSSEAVARPLASLPAAKQRHAWANAVAAAPSGKPTARQVAVEINKIVPISGHQAPGKLGSAMRRPERGLDHADAAIEHLSQIDPRDLYREEAFDKVETWITKHRKQKRKAIAS
jgi:pyruvate/2-oxoglutarate dehydrogenase complex dihydrolipoamide acyltransferase (E2) component